MLETGMGMAAMAKALKWCLQQPHFEDRPYRPRFVLSLGFSGALQPSQRVGDIIVATEVVDRTGKCWSVNCPQIFGSFTNATRGRLLTMSQLVSEPSEKRWLGEQFQAVAVDMETAVAAQLCRVHGVPFTCLRVISDEVDTALSPHLAALLRGGQISLASLAVKLIRHPTLIRDLWRLANSTRRAAKKLQARTSLLGQLNRLMARAVV
jgi:adenosylhomocysteine nucleosidase